MAVLTLTAASILADTPLPKLGTAGGTIIAGYFLYADASDAGSLKAAFVDSLAGSTVVGIALESATDGQPIAYAERGIITVGSGIFSNTGEIIVLSNTAGKAQLAADLTSNQDDYLTVLGWSLSASTMQLSIGISGVKYNSAP